MPRQENTVSAAIGGMLQSYIQSIVGWSQAQIADFPEILREWLENNGFELQNTPDPVRPGHNQTDWQGFWGWARNGMLSLGAYLLLFELYSMVLGGASGDATTFSWALAVGVVFFLAIWLLLVFAIVGRISRSLCWIVVLFTLALAGVFITGPLLELNNPSNNLGQFWSQPALYSFVLLSVARGWAALGFALGCILIAPLLWTGLIGPVVLAAIAESTGKKLHEVFALIRRLIPLGKPESDAALEELKKLAIPQTNLLQSILAGLAFLALPLFLYPTVTGLMAGVGIAMLAMVVVFLIRKEGFRGYFFRKFIYALCCGGLIFVGSFYGVKLVVQFIISVWGLGWNWSGPAILALAAGLTAVVWITLTATTQDEQLERRTAQVNVDAYKLQVSGFREFRDDHGHIQHEVLFARVTPDSTSTTTRTESHDHASGDGHHTVQVRTSTVRQLSKIPRGLGWFAVIVGGTGLIFWMLGSIFEVNFLQAFRQYGPWFMFNNSVAESIRQYFFIAVIISAAVWYYVHKSVTGRG